MSRLKIVILMFILTISIFFIYYLSNVNLERNNRKFDSSMNCLVCDIGNFIIIKLPYHPNVSSKYIFSEDTCVALDIISIYSDGKKLSLCYEDIRELNPSNVEIKPCINPNATFYIEMCLTKWGKQYIWNDGRGFRAKKIAENMYENYTHSYVMDDTTRKLEITYRVLLPRPTNHSLDYTLELLNEEPKDGQYSQIYTKVINIGEKK